MLKIGEFATLSGITIVMLRHYDKIGLITPQYIEKESGYRYYDPSQLVDANRIVYMKSMGFGLDEIKTSISMGQDELTCLINEKIREKEREQQEIISQLTRLKELSIYSGTEEKYILGMVRKEMPDVYRICLAGRYNIRSAEGMLWKEFGTEVGWQRLSSLQNATAGSVCRPQIQENDEIDMEIFVVSTKEISVRKPLECKRISAHEVLQITFIGKYEQANCINGAIAKWLEANSFELIGEPYIYYLRSPKNTSNEEEFLSEIYFPIKKIIF